MDRIPLWIDIRHIALDKRAPFLDAAQSHGVEAILVGADEPQAARPGRPEAITVEEGDLHRDGGVIGRWVTVSDKQSENEAAAVDGIVVVENQDWTIIPLENLIAGRQDRPGTLYAVTTDPEQAAVYRDTLEHGVHGIVLSPSASSDIALADQLLRGKGLPDARTVHSADVGLLPARVTAIQDAETGDRVCVDTTSIFHDGEGLLIGSSARAFALVHAETIESQFVAARAFRVNAGAVHSYVLGPGGRTCYLSELAAGSKVLAVSRDGARELTVGRAKFERRPHVIVHWTGPGGDGSVVLQNAETIRLVRPDGGVVSVTDLEEGDEILVHNETAARHFGMPVDEHLEER